MADLITDQRIAEFSKRIGRDRKDDRLRITGNEIAISKLNETVGIHNKRLDNLTAAAQGKNFVFQTDADAAYSKLVPAGAMPYAGVKSIGGKTMVWNNIFIIGGKSTSFGIMTDNRDGSYTFSLTEGESTLNQYFNNITDLKNYPENHKLLFMVDKDVSSYFKRYSINVLNNKANNDGITHYNHSKRGRICSFAIPFGYFGMSGIASKTAEITVRPMVFDLTLMFGAGNEPSTVEEFEAMFPDDYYPYDAGTLNVIGSSYIPPSRTKPTGLRMVCWHG